MNQIADLNLVTFYARVWRAGRVWAEDMLCTTFKIAAPSDVLSLPGGWPQPLPGTSWSYRILDRSINVFSNDGQLGITFDLDTLEPSVAQLRELIGSQVEAGRDNNHRHHYLRILAADDFEEIATEAIANSRTNTSTLAQRTEMRAAQNSDHPVDSLTELVQRWKANGCSRQDAIERFSQLLRESIAFNSELREDAVRDVFDFIGGWCSPKADLFPNG